MKTWFAAALVLVIIFTGCSFFKKAEITEMVPGMSMKMDKLECWLTIEFKKYPNSIDLRDVKVRFSSIALEADQEFGWDYIAENDVISLGFMKGFKENTESIPEGKPPLNVAIKVNYPLRAKPELNMLLSDTIWLNATLFWGGKKIDSYKRGINHVYKPASSE